MLMKLCTGDWENRLESMNTRVDKYNGISMGIVKVSIRKVLQFSINVFRNNIGCLILDPNFGLDESRL